MQIADIGEEASEYCRWLAESNMHHHRHKDLIHEMVDMDYGTVSNVFDIAAAHYRNHYEKNKADIIAKIVQCFDQMRRISEKHTVVVTRAA
jgi:hypothetical protein